MFSPSLSQYTIYGWRFSMQGNGNAFLSVLHVATLRSLLHSYNCLSSSSYKLCFPLKWNTILGLKLGVVSQGRKESRYRVGKSGYYCWLCFYFGFLCVSFLLCWNCLPPQSLPKGGPGWPLHPGHSWLYHTWTLAPRWASEIHNLQNLKKVVRRGWALKTEGHVKVGSDLGTMATRAMCKVKSRGTGMKKVAGRRREQMCRMKQKQEGVTFHFLQKPRLDSVRLSWTLIVNLPLLN